MVGSWVESGQTSSTTGKTSYAGEYKLTTTSFYSLDPGPSLLNSRSGVTVVNRLVGTLTDGGRPGVKRVDLSLPGPGTVSTEILMVNVSVYTRREPSSEMKCIGLYG